MASNFAGSAAMTTVKPARTFWAQLQWVQDGRAVIDPNRIPYRAPNSATGSSITLTPLAPAPGVRIIPSMEVGSLEVALWTDPVVGDLIYTVPVLRPDLRVGDIFTLTHVNLELHAS